ncbi:MAG: hypothetical protein AB2A00_01325 [Myxococcota bacterium]
MSPERIIQPAGLLFICLIPLLKCACVEEVVVHRDNCLVCHQPRDESGTPRGIEEAHPWYPLNCVDCHGGNARVCDGVKTMTPYGPECDGNWIYDKNAAHVSPKGGRKYIKNLSVTQLNAVDKAYLRFINPGDLRVVDQTCGQCHVEEAMLVPRSTMAHTSGELTVARYRAGVQQDTVGHVAGVTVNDPTYESTNTCSTPFLQMFDPAPMTEDSRNPDTRLSVENAQETYLVKSCNRCHLWDFGENRMRGDFRSSGCSACHMPYADDGRSQSADPRIPKQTTPHPIKHQLTSAIPAEACMHCHYRGGRIGPSFHGYRESSGPGLNPPDVDALGVSLHGHDPNYYLTDEDTTNAWDETPPDVHQEAGMTCVDCHTREEIHSDGHLYADTQCSVKTECVDCHGTVREYARPGPGHDNLQWRDGKLYLRAKLTGAELLVTQVRDTVTPGNPRYTEEAALAMGVNAQGYSHTDTLECYTCHAGWLPSCYGCHVEVDMTLTKRVQTTGRETPGSPSGNRRWVGLNDLVLMWNTDGKLAPSMPSERLFMTVLVRDEEKTAEQGALVKKAVFTSKPREFPLPDGGVMPGFGQRAFNPHTTRRRSQFMACDRCHSVETTENPVNNVLLDLTYGFGTQRFLQQACDIQNEDPSCDPATDFTTYPLDAVQTREGQSLVVVGHPVPNLSRPLSLDEIDRMRSVVLPRGTYLETPCPNNAATDLAWPQPMRLR